MPRSGQSRRDGRRGVRLALVAGVLAVAAPGTARSQANIGSAFLTVPTPATSAGFVYRYDPGSGSFVREREVAGQVYVERPAPLGSGRWNFNLSYQWFDFGDTERFFNGTRIHEITAAATYGVTDDLDLNLTVPVLYFPQTGTLSVDPVFLRAKYRLLDRAALQLALGVVLRTLTLSLFDSRAVGRVQPGLFLYASRARLPVGHGMYLQPYANLGVDADDTGTQSLEVRWAGGLDWSVSDRFTTALAFLAYHRPNASGSFTDPTDLYDVSLGVRVNLWRETLIGFANVLVPANRPGLDAVPLVGLEATI
jgi:hypothetical protein